MHLSWMKKRMHCFLPVYGGNVYMYIILKNPHYKWIAKSVINYGSYYLHQQKILRPCTVLKYTIKHGSKDIMCQKNELQKMIVHICSKKRYKMSSPFWVSKTIFCTCKVNYNASYGSAKAKLKCFTVLQIWFWLRLTLI